MAYEQQPLIASASTSPETSVLDTQFSPSAEPPAYVPPVNTTITQTDTSSSLPYTGEQESQPKPRNILKVALSPLHIAFLVTFGIDGLFYNGNEWRDDSLHGVKYVARDISRDQTKVVPGIVPMVVDPFTKDALMIPAGYTDSGLPLEQDLHIHKRLAELASKELAVLSFFGLPTKNVLKSDGSIKRKNLAKNIFGYPTHNNASTLRKLATLFMAPISLLAIPFRFLTNVTKLVEFGPTLLKQAAFALDVALAKKYTPNNPISFGKRSGVIALRILLKISFLLLSTIELAARTVLSPFKSARIAFTFGNSLGGKTGLVAGSALALLSLAATTAAYTFFGMFLLPVVLPKVLPALPSQISKAVTWFSSTALPWLQSKLSPFFTAKLGVSNGVAVTASNAIGTAGAVVGASLVNESMNQLFTPASPKVEKEPDIVLDVKKATPLTAVKGAVNGVAKTLGDSMKELYHDGANRVGIITENAPSAKKF